MLHRCHLQVCLGFLLLMPVTGNSSSSVFAGSAIAQSQSNNNAPTTQKYNPAWLQPLLSDLASTDSEIHKGAVASLAEHAQKQPRIVAQYLKELLDPMLQAGLYDQVLTVTFEAIPRKAADTTTMSEIMIARTRSLLILEKNDQALSEAKSAYNIASQKVAGEAATLLATAIDKTLAKTDPSILEQFRREQVFGADSTEPTLFSSISVDTSVFDPALPKKLKSSRYEDLIGAGNLLLASDKPDEARTAFLRAWIANTTTEKEKKLLTVVEGLIRVERSRLGSFSAGNRIVDALKYSPDTCPELNELLNHGATTSDMVDAARHLGQAKFSADFMMFADQPGANSQSIVQGLIDLPIKVVASAKPTDARVVEWLRTDGENHTASDDARTDLSRILNDTQLSPVVLLDLAESFDTAMKDRWTTGVIYSGAAAQAHRILIDESRKNERLDILRAIDRHRQNIKDIFWALVQERNHDATAFFKSLYIDYITYCPADDQRLVEQLGAVKIGLGGSYYTLGNPADALTVLDDVKESDLKGGDITALHWARGLSLYRLKNYHRAKVEFSRVLDDPKFKDRPGAWRNLIICTNRSGDNETAHVLFENYIKVYNPSNIKLALLTRAMEDMVVGN